VKFINNDADPFVDKVIIIEKEYAVLASAPIVNPTTGNITILASASSAGIRTMSAVMKISPPATLSCTTKTIAASSTLKKPTRSPAR
jgi:hypothetical protein